METFFTKDKNFYKVFFRLMLVVALQNLVAYSVNMLDNMMLGSYDQNALSGAATVNQIFFVVNQLAIAIGNALIVMSSQYWGKKDTYAIRKLTGIVLIFSLLAAMIILVICSAFPEQLLGLFTTSPDIIMEGQTYLKILKWTFVLFLISNLLISMLRSVETVQISFVVSVVSLIVNGGIIYPYADCNTGTSFIRCDCSKFRSNNVLSVFKSNSSSDRFCFLCSDRKVYRSGRQK